MGLTTNKVYNEPKNSVGETFLTLSDGTKMPVLGLGTWQSEGDILETALEVALEAGYRHIDTAQVYGNEEAIGKVLKRWLDSGRLMRKDLFVTTKLASPSMYPDKVEECLMESLKKLQLDYVDLYLIHFPVTFILGEDLSRIDGHPDIHYLDIWKKLEEQHDACRSKNIGVSNFNAQQIDRLLRNCRIKPEVNQIELHVYLQQKDLVDFCLSKGVNIIAYSPLGSRGYNEFLQKVGQLPRELRNPLEDKVVVEIAEKCEKTPAQILLKYLLHLGVAVIPKSVNPERIKENYNVFDFYLRAEDIQRLRGLNIGPPARVCNFDVPNIREHPEFPF